jgi:GTP-binding protein
VQFVDEVTIKVKSGDGGAGMVAFRRESFVPRGGPAGGDGGHGGSVALEADENLRTLLDLRRDRHFAAGDGEDGGGSEKRGADGDDVTIRVPAGTVVRAADTDRILGDLTEHGDRLTVAEGGRGGRGNAFFKSSTNQAPRKSQPGEPGEERAITLELKLLADVGLVGFPNAGKSTLVSTLSAAKPEVADYPFTTLVPSLGMVYLSEYQSFAMADIPGIIEDAHEGKGLGLQFLRHIERNAVLLFTVPITSNDPAGEYQTLLDELRAYNPHLTNKPRLVALTKMDVLAPDERALAPDLMDEAFPDDVEVLPVSAAAQIGLGQLKRALWERVKGGKPAAQVR